MIAQYQGLNVNELDTKRTKRKDLFKITKQNYKIATKKSKKDLEKYFTGPTAAALHQIHFNSKILTKFQN